MIVSQSYFIPNNHNWSTKDQISQYGADLNLFVFRLWSNKTLASNYFTTIVHVISQSPFLLSKFTYQNDTIRQNSNNSTTHISYSVATRLCLQIIHIIEIFNIFNWIQKENRVSLETLKSKFRNKKFKIFLRWPEPHQPKMFKTVIRGFWKEMYGDNYDFDNFRIAAYHSERHHHEKWHQVTRCYHSSTSAKDP